MSNTVREPKQQRSIDKKNRIIQAGYQLFADSGYFNTNTAEIAKKAGVSTGIVYGYFHDKRDILLDVLDIYIDHVFKPVFSLFDNLPSPINFAAIIPLVVDNTVTMHRSNAAMHETLHSLTATDELVSNKFLSLEGEMTKKIVSRLIELGYNDDNIYEKVHLSIETVQSYAHECVYDKHSYIDYEVMRDLIIGMLMRLFVNKE